MNLDMLRPRAGDKLFPSKHTGDLVVVLRNQFIFFQLQLNALKKENRLPTLERLLRVKLPIEDNRKKMPDKVMFIFSDVPPTVIASPRSLP